MWFLFPLAAFGYMIKKGLNNNSGQQKAVVTGALQNVVTKAQIENEAYGKFKEALRQNEGFELRVYHLSKDPAGVLTVGIGHKVLPADKLKLGDTITVARAMTFFEKDSMTAFNAAKSQAKEIGVYTAEFLLALAEVNYQLGTGWKYEWKNTYALLKNGNYKKAIQNILNSPWATKQTPVRAYNFVVAIRNAFENNVA